MVSYPGTEADWILETPFLNGLSSYPGISTRNTHPDSTPLILDHSTSELFTYSKNSQITPIKEKMNLNSTVACVLEFFFHAIAEPLEFNIKLANRKNVKMPNKSYLCI